jgi:hypothetical protein
MRFFKTKLAAVLTLAATSLSLLLGATPASASEQTWVPDPGIWCADWAERNSKEALGFTYIYTGLKGSMAKNNMKCELVYKIETEEIGHHMFFRKQPVNFNQACAEQFPGTHVKWFEPMAAPMANIPYGNALAAQMGFTWQCVR